METALIPLEIQKKFEGEIASIVDGTSTLKSIDNNQQFENAVALTKTVKSIASSLEDGRDALVRPRNNEVDFINDWFRPKKEQLQSVEKSLKSVIKGYQDKIELARLERQRIADEAARKERERIEAEARAQRDKEAAAQRAQEEARRKQEEARRVQEEAERRAREAQDAESRKIAEKQAAEARKQAEAAAKEEARAREKESAAASAAQLKETVAESVVAVEVAPQITKPDGVATVTTYTANVTNKAAAIRHCVDTGKFHLVDLNMKIIDKMASAEKEFFSMPGVEVIKKQDLRMRK